MKDVFYMKDKKIVNPFSENSKILANKFDSATIAKNTEELELLINQALEIIENENVASQAQIYYSIGTAYSDIAILTGISNDESLREKQLFYFRKSLSLIESKELEKLEYRPYILGFKFNLYTNYANALKHLGRNIAAIEQYKKVLDINPNFGMSLGNIGEAYQYYGLLVFDPAQRDYLHNCAYGMLSKAIRSNDPNMYSKAKEYFKHCIEQYDSEYVKKVLAIPLDIPQYDYPDSNELQYRKWALHNNLFLNPLNDLPYYEFCFAADVLHLPNMIVNINAKPIFHGMYNQIKQEYIFARYQYYCGLQMPKEPHSADKDTYLLQFADYPQYSIRIEQLKCSFKTLYSLLDKVAFFINSYFELGISERDVSFFSIWKTEKKGKTSYKYKNVLDPYSNFAISSLYWISKDFYKPFTVSPNPVAQRISKIRNALEHKYVKVYWAIIPDRANGEIDDLALYVSEDELKAETLWLLKLIREIIICLSLAVNIEENKRRKNLEDKIIPTFNFLNYDDEWKI